MRTRVGSPQLRREQAAYRARYAACSRRLQRAVDADAGTAAASTALLLRRHTAIDRHRASRHERCRVGEQPCDRFGDLRRLAHPRYRLDRDQPLPDSRIRRNEALDHCRIDHTRTYAINSDIRSRVFEGARLRQPHDPMLGRRIRWHPMRADESRGRCSINDSAATLLHHLQNLVLHAEPYAAQIHRYYAIEVFLGFVGDASDFAADSRVVKGTIEPPPGFDRDRNERLDVRPTRNVALGEHRVATRVRDQLHGLLAAVLDHVGDEYPRTLARESECSRPADTRGAAGYERYFALKQSCHLLSRVCGRAYP